MMANSVDRDPLPTQELWSIRLDSLTALMSLAVFKIMEYWSPDHRSPLYQYCQESLAQLA